MARNKNRNENTSNEAVEEQQDNQAVQDSGTNETFQEGSEGSTEAMEGQYVDYTDEEMKEREEKVAQEEEDKRQKETEEASKPVQNSAEDNNVYTLDGETTEENETSEKDLTQKRSELLEIVVSRIEQSKDLDTRDPYTGINFGNNLLLKKDENFSDDTEKFEGYYIVNGRFRLEGENAKKVDEALRKNAEAQEEKELDKFLEKQSKPFE